MGPVSSTRTGSSRNIDHQRPDASTMSFLLGRVFFFEFAGAAAALVGSVPRVWLQGGDWPQLHSGTGACPIRSASGRLLNTALRVPHSRWARNVERNLGSDGRPTLSAVAAIRVIQRWRRVSLRPRPRCSPTVCSWPPWSRVNRGGLPNVFSRPSDDVLGMLAVDVVKDCLKQGVGFALFARHEPIERQTSTTP